MEFRKIDCFNYWDCMNLSVASNQKYFVADNKQSLVEAAYEKGLYPLGIYHQEKMIGFLLYDYDESIPGWSLSRFMIDKAYQGRGYGKQAVLAFLDYFKEKYHQNKIFISVSLENKVAMKMYKEIGFKEVKEIEYMFLNHHYKEMQMIKEWE